MRGEHRRRWNRLHEGLDWRDDDLERTGFLSIRGRRRGIRTESQPAAQVLPLRRTLSAGHPLAWLRLKGRQKFDPAANQLDVLTGLVGLETAIQAMSQALPSYRRQHAALNERALRAGAEAVPAGAASAWPEPGATP